MKMTKKKWICLILAAILLCGIGFFSNPFFRVGTFVMVHGELLEESLCNGSGVPVIWGLDTFNTWEGAHSMTEFILLSRGQHPGKTYYGCYYSYDDVPLAFQNIQTELTQDGHDYWVWQADGDLHGATQRLRENWYYFEAVY